MGGTKTSAPDLLEPEAHVFSGTVRVWGPHYAELVTDSGVTIPLIPRSHADVPEGARITVVVRKYRPLYQIDEVRKG
jgi:hypothetical protein